MIELEVIGVTARPRSDEQKERLREQAQALAEQPGPPKSVEQKQHLTDEVQALAAQRAEQPEPWVRLKERTGDRVLEFGIGPAEAAAIAMALQGVRQPRPMTHDFIGNLLGVLDDVSVLRVIITKREFPAELARQLADGKAVLLGGTETFYAELELRHRDRVISVDCRPSDGIAVAVRLGAPIVAADDPALWITLEDARYKPPRAAGSAASSIRCSTKPGAVHLVGSADPAAGCVVDPPAVVDA